MLIGIISDTHDNIWNLAKAIEYLNNKKAAILIHCGDFCAPFVVKELGNFNGEVHGVFGYIDGDQYTMTKLAYTKIKNVTLHGDLGEIEIGDKKIAFVHDHRFGKALAVSGEYDVVFHGHTHKATIETHHGKLLVNPGEIMGRKFTPSFALYDTDTGEVKIEKLR